MTRRFVSIPDADFRSWHFSDMGLMSDLSPLPGVERKSNFGAVRSVDDPEQTSEVGRSKRKHFPGAWAAAAREAR